MKNYWQEVKLGDICEYSRNRISISEVNLCNYVSTENLLKERAGKTIADTIPEQANLCEYNKGCTLISNIRPYFKKIWFANTRGGCSNDVLVYKPNNGINDKWLYYLLSQDSFFNFVMSGTKGTKMPRGDKSQIMKFPVALPPLDEQRKIAGVLSAFDDKIELNNKINRNLEAQAQAIFKSWFIDFEPFKNGKFIDSELGKIPEGWSVSKLTNSLNIKYGKNLPQSKLTKTGYPVYGANGQIGFFPQIMYKKPQVLISCRGAASGKVITSEKNSFITNNSLILDYSDTTIPFSFVKYWALSTDFSPYVSGSAQPQITIDSLSTMNLTIPDEIILKKFNNIVIPILDKIFSNNAEIIRLSQLRDILLPRLLSGEINISDYIA